MKIRNVLLLKRIILALLLARSPATTAQSIGFTQIPPPGSAGYVYGIVHDVDPSKYGVALFIEVFGTEWTKPTFADPITPIQADGAFAGNIVTGGQDACAQTVSAYVVPLNTDPRTIRASGEGSLPPALDQVSIAHTSALRSPVVALNSTRPCRKSNRFGITPTIVAGDPSKVTAYSTTFGSAPSRFRQNRSLTTATRPPPGVCSSGRNVRSRIGFTPRMSNRLAVTVAPNTSSGTSPLL